MIRAGVFISLALLSFPSHFMRRSPGNGFVHSGNGFLRCRSRSHGRSGAGIGSRGMGGAGGGQTEYSANAEARFHAWPWEQPFRHSASAPSSEPTSKPGWMFALFGSYTNLTHDFSRSGFGIALDIGMANAGCETRLLSARRFSRCVSAPGYLFSIRTTSRRLFTPGQARLSLSTMSITSHPTPIRSTAPEDFRWVGAASCDCRLRAFRLPQRTALSASLLKPGWSSSARRSRSSICLARSAA